MEDVVADLADDGILNLSAGSDTVHESEDLIDPRRFVRVRKLRAEAVWPRCIRDWTSKRVST